MHDRKPLILPFTALGPNFNPQLEEEHVLTILNVFIRLKLSPALYSARRGAYAHKKFQVFGQALNAM